MTTEGLDHCKTCAVKTPHLQCCSQLHNLKVTRGEYDRVFRRFAGEFDVQDRGSYLQITAINGRGCPHWIDQTCSIYEQRPMECRLYPYTLEDMTDRGDTIEAWVHGGANCPSRAALLPSHEVTEQLVTGFLGEIAPDKTPIVTITENPGPVRIRARRAIRHLLGAKGAPASAP